MPRSIWIDVEDLFEFAAANPRPSGIQRMAFEVYKAVLDLEGRSGRINFVRHNNVNCNFTILPWQEIETLFNRLSQGSPACPSAAVTTTRYISPALGPRIESPLRRTVRKMAYRMPLEIRHRAFTTARLQADAIRALTDLIQVTARRAWSGRSRLVPKTRAVHGNRPVSSLPFDQAVQPGDVILLLGAPWSSPNYAHMIERARDEFDIEFAVLIYDLIPIRRPEWCDRGLVRLFGEWLASTLPVSDYLFTISCATAADIKRFIHKSGLSMRTLDINVIPVGTSFGNDAPPVWTASTEARSRLPEPGTYALFVSTIEARKNHVLLFRVWRQLMETIPASELPILVFAGRVGWLVADLMEQLENTSWLDGKIRLIEAPTDDDIAALYRGCMFTLFPSLYEGWGLPVTESLANGKPCLASNITSMPEAGGTLARYFDPDSVTDAYRVIRDTITDKPGLAAWQAEIARSFKPVAWTETATSILRTLGAETPVANTARPKEPTV